MDKPQTLRLSRKLFFVLLLLWPFSAFASPPSPLTLTLLPTAGTIRYDKSRGGYNIGTVDPMQSVQLKHNFTLENQNTVPVTIERLENDCPCLDMGLINRRLPAVVPPGKSVSITVALDPTMFHISRRHTVLVYLTGQKFSAASLEMLGYYQSPIVFSSPVLDFGSVAVGEQRSLPLTVRLARNFSSSFGYISLLALVSSLPDLKIEQLSIVPPPPPIKRDRNGDVEYGLHDVFPDAEVPTLITYQLTLIPTKTLGPFNTRISLISPGEPHLLILQGANSIAIGNRVGDISASPAAVDFGQVPLGTPATKQVLIVGTKPGSLDNLEVHTASPFLTASLIPSTSLQSANHAPKKAMALKISLNSKPPLGMTQTQVTVITGTKQELVVPITLSVFATAGNP